MDSISGSCSRKAASRTSVLAGPLTAHTLPRRMERRFTLLLQVGRCPQPFSVRRMKALFRRSLILPMALDSSSRSPYRTDQFIHTTSESGPSDKPVLTGSSRFEVWTHHVH